MLLRRAVHLSSSLERRTRFPHGVLHFRNAVYKWRASSPTVHLPSPHVSCTATRAIWVCAAGIVRGDSNKRVFRLRLACICLNARSRDNAHCRAPHRDRPLLPYAFYHPVSLQWQLAALLFR